MSLYYRIWVDSIKRIRSIEKNKDDWKIKIIIIMSVAMTYNLMMIMAILQRNILGISFYGIESPLLSELENDILTILVLFFLPCISINYLLIFRRNRYEKLLEKYPYYNGKLFVIYFLTSMFLPIVLLGIGLLIKQI
jgi:hypothetical protein